MTGVPRGIFWAAVAACLVVAFSGCATVKPAGAGAAGAGIGFLAGGPLGGAVGAGVGAAGGALWQETGRAQDERDECRKETTRLHEALNELRATLLANGQIDAYNAGARKAVPHVAPPPSDAPSWFSLAWKALLGLLGAGTAYHFRHPLGAWSRGRWAWLQDKLRGRAPSHPKPTEPPPYRTPLNPEP